MSNQIKNLFIFLQLFCCCTFLSADQFLARPDELIRLKFIKDIQIAPNHECALIVATETQTTNENMAYVSKIYKCSLECPQKLIEIGSKDVSNFRPRWSPDNKWIAFLSDDQGIHHLYLMDAKGENIRELVQGNKSVQTFRWSPDSKQIAFVMSDLLPCQKENLSTYNTPNTINRLWLIDIEQSEPIALTSDQYCVRGVGDFGTVNEEFDWSQDGRQIVFAYSPSQGSEDFFLDSSLAIIDLQKGLIKPLEKKTRHEALPKYSPDGKWIAFLASAPPAYAFNKYVNVISADGENRKQLAPTSNDGPNFFGASLLGWTPDSAHVILYEPKGTKYHLVLLPLNGDPAKEIDTKNWLIKEPSFNGKMLGFMAQNPNYPPEAFTSDLSTFLPMQLTRMNESMIVSNGIKTELIKWKSSDGLEIEGLLTYPAGYRPANKYPLILMVHGGPMGSFDESFIGSPSLYSEALFANAGFLVLKPNPRGSNGYGKKFRCLNYGDWGGKDMEDLLTGVEAVVKRGLADENQLGVMGWSYGGYMTARIITQTNQFKAATMGAGVCNLASFSGTSDLHCLASDYLGDFWHNPALYQERSPVYSAGKVETPCLILHGLADARVPPGQAHEFYQALQKHQKQVKMVLYPGMGHGCFDPKMQMAIMQENLDWFKLHLKP